VAAVVITHNVSLVAQVVFLSACKQQQTTQAHVHVLSRTPPQQIICWQR
jgi:hypothetical protein